MFRYSKQIVLAIALVFVFSACCENTYAQKRRSGGSSRSSSSSKYSSGSKKSSSSSNKYSSGSKKSSSSSNKYSSGSKKSSSGSSKYSSPGSNKGTQSGGSSKYSSPGTGSSKPSTGTGSTTGSRKPSTSGNSKTSANQAATSKRQYQETKKATAPPKSSYRTSDGKEVKVRTSSSHVQTMRSRPSSYYTPAARQTRTTSHIHHYHYSHDYDWYYGQPRVYVGGGYSSAFWWMMSEWSAERRARWLYHNRNNIESNAYQRGLQDAAVAAQIQQLEAQNVAINSDYLDPEFSDNPDVMYSQDYVEAAYNPTIVSTKGSETALTILLWMIIIGVVCYSLYFILAKVKFGE